MRDFHVHTCFSDGKNTPEEMVLAAIDKGMDAIGFSDHSYTHFDESYCLKKETICAYQDCIGDLKEKYKDQIQIFCGIEQDFYSDACTTSFDYVIGSVHYLRIGQDYIPVDEAPDILLETAKKYFAGDIYALAELYFDTVSGVAEKTNADIIGHFDLITKFSIFDTKHPRYQKASRTAADILLKSGKPFEINTSQIYRGKKSEPYPETALLSYIANNGGSFILSGDCHEAAMLCHAFSRFSDFRTSGFLPNRK